MYKVKTLCSDNLISLEDKINEFLNNQMPQFELFDIKLTIKETSTTHFAMIIYSI